MHDRVWEYLGVMYDDATWPDTDPLSAIDEVWADRGQAVNELIAGFAQAEPAQEDDEAREQLATESDAFPQVGLMASVPEVLILVLSKGVNAIFAEKLESILDRFESSSAKEKCVIAFFLAERGIGSCKSRAGLMLIDTLGKKKSPQISNTRCQAARALGKVEDADETLVKLLSELAADTCEVQSVRATCIEALMDLGPIAKSSTSILQQIKEEDEDEDLQMFAWSALKSVTAESKEHPCGGSVADHMRSLYSTEGFD
jgi:hypothetical protein